MLIDRLKNRWPNHASRLDAIAYITYRVRKSFLTMVGMLIIIIFLAVALLAPNIAPYPEDVVAVHVDNTFRSPCGEHPFGTDDMGRDIFSRIIFGARLSLMIGVIVVVVSAAVGTPLGLIAGFVGGRVSEIIMRIADIFMSIPYLLLALAVAAALGPNLRNAMIAVSIPWWPIYARLTRAQTLLLKEELYVRAAQTMGASTSRIIFRHILPNCLPLLIVQSSLQFGQAILAAAALGFVGIGAPPPTPEWGLMVSIGRQYMPEWWWLSIIPGIAIFLTVLGFNLFGDGLRDIIDPRLR